MNDVNLAVGLFVLGQADVIRRLAERAAEPWAAENAEFASDLRFLRFREARVPAPPKSRPGFLVRFNQLFEPAGSDLMHDCCRAAC